METIKIFEAFSGYGSQSIALERLHLPYEVVGISEINKYALEAYYANHDKSIKNFGDIKQIDPKNLPDFNLFTYSFPCQDISVAGKQLGINENTRSGLLYECKKIIEEKLPKYLLLENVKQLVGKKFKNDFDSWLKYLSSLGYFNYWYILNAKDFNIPQNRERVFCISILNEEKELNIRTALLTNDILEFIDFSNTNFKGKIDEATTGIGAFRGRKESDGKYHQRFELKNLPYCNTLTTVAKDNIYVRNGLYRPFSGKECLRLMGLNEEEIENITLKVSENQCRKLAGNSIVIPVLESIFKAIFIGNN